MAKVVTFGEIMLRLKSPAYERLFQSPSLEATFGGGEANVSVSLANYGMETAFVTVLPTNDVGNACIRELRGFGVDVRLISPGFVKTPLTDRNDFPMPFLLERDDAVRRIRRGLDSNRFEIAFPRRLQWSLQLLSVLPKPLYFRALKSMLRDDRKLAK